MDDAATEHVMIAVAVKVGAVLVVPCTLVAWLVRGPDGALTAFAGVAVVVALFWVTGRSLAWGAARGGPVLMAVALGGFALRVIAMGIAAVTLGGRDVVDGPVLVAVVALTEMTMLVLEARYALAHRELWWLVPVSARAGEVAATGSNGRREVRG